VLRRDPEKQVFRERDMNGNLNGQCRGKCKTLDKYLKYPESRYWSGHLHGLSLSWLTHADIFLPSQLCRRITIFFSSFLFFRSDRIISATSSFRNYPKLDQMQKFVILIIFIFFTISPYIYIYIYIYMIMRLSSGNGLPMTALRAVSLKQRNICKC